MGPSLASRVGRRLRAGLLAAAGILLSAGAAAGAAAPADSLTVTIVPKDQFPPSAVTDLAATPGAEGQMMLQWTAPDGNNYVFATLSPAAGYQIRIATFSVDSVGGSTVAWWNAAADVRNLPAPAIPATPPAPAFPGTTQFLLINGLWPGVTYYALIISSDSAGNVSDADVHARTPGAQANALIFDAAPPAPLGLSVTPVGSHGFTVSWSSVSVYDLDYYKVYFDSTPPYDFSHSSVTRVSGASTTQAFSGLSTGTYIVKVTAVDRGLPAYPGVALESVAASSVAIVLRVVAHPPQSPYGVALSSSATGVTLRWMPTVRYEDKIPFAVATAPAVDELSGYRVYRATSPVLGGWADVADLSTGTLTWTDLAGGPQYYYHVRSENDSSLSQRSVIRSVGSLSAYAVAPDDQSYFEVMAPSILPVEGVPNNPDTAYLITVSSRGEDLGGLNGRVVKSVEFDAYRGGQLLAPDFAIDGLGVLRLHYQTASSSVTPSGLSAAGVAATPDNMSVYWYNGKNWVQLYGTLDTSDQTMRIQTKYFGRYQLRTVERAGAFLFNPAGISNRFLTPNGDGKNDDVVFTFDNPRDSAVTGKIIDLHGRVIVGSLPPGPISNSLIWDGTAGGRVVPGGVYIYQIQAEGHTFNGTIVVIR